MEVRIHRLISVCMLPVAAMSMLGAQLWRGDTSATHKYYLLDYRTQSADSPVQVITSMPRTVSQALGQLSHPHALVVAARHPKPTVLAPALPTVAPPPAATSGPAVVPAPAPVVTDAPTPAPTVTTTPPPPPPAPATTPGTLMAQQSAYVQGVFACIRGIESHTTPGAVNSTSGDGGLYQFNVNTWLANGGGQFAPNAQSASVAAQNTVAVWTYQHDGFSPWTGDNSCGF